MSRTRPVESRRTLPPTWRIDRTTKGAEQMTYMWTGRKGHDEAAPAPARKAWASPRIERLAPGTPQHDRARQALAAGSEG